MDDDDHEWHLQLCEDYGNGCILDNGMEQDLDDWEDYGCMDNIGDMDGMNGMNKETDIFVRLGICDGDPIYDPQYPEQIVAAWCEEDDKNFTWDFERVIWIGNKKDKGCPWYMFNDDLIIHLLQFFHFWFVFRVELKYIKNLNINYCNTNAEYTQKNMVTNGDTGDGGHAAEDKPASKVIRRKDIVWVDDDAEFF